MSSVVAPSPFSASTWVNNLLARDPERVVLVSKRRRIAAKTLSDEVEAYRSGLRAAGISAGDVVAIAAERNESAVAVWLACLADGVLPFFVDPRQDTDVLMKLLDAVRIHGLYCGDALDKASFQSRLPYLKWMGEQGVSGASSIAPLADRSDAPAFIMHSAGTCGLPRAIYHNADAITWQAKALTNALRFKPDAVVWFTGTLASAAVQSVGLFALLNCGGTLVLDDPAESLSSAARTEAQTILLLAEARDTKLWNAEKLLSIKGNVTAVLVTDNLLTEEQAQLISRATDAALWTGFYSSETAGFVAMNTVPGVWPYTSAGRAIGGAEFAVVGNDGVRCSSEAIGRLTVRDCPRPVKVTSLTFRPGNKNELQDYAVTGDWVRLDDQDFLHCEGCERSVFDKGGFQVRAMAIEEALRGVTGIEAAVVFSLPAEEIENEIAAALVPAGSQPEPVEIQDALGDQLPRFMVPTKYSIINNLRHTPSGKQIRYGFETSLRPAEKAVASVGPIVADLSELPPSTSGRNVDQTE